MNKTDKKLDSILEAKEAREGILEHNNLSVRDNYLKFFLLVGEQSALVESIFTV